MDYRRFHSFDPDEGAKPLNGKLAFDEAYGELIPFTGIGDVVAKNSPSSRQTRLLFPPWVDAASRRVRRPALVSFYVLDTDPRTMESALKVALKRSSETIKVAIVTSPISFGASKLDLRFLASLRSTFDYTFIIENHVLQMPTGLAPRLTASSRAVKYVRACVDGIMQIVWADADITSAKRFYAIFPRDGFCLVGRAGATKNSSSTNVLLEAVGTTINERLPFKSAKRVVVIGPSSVVNDGRTISFMNDTAEVTSHGVISIASISPRPAATILGFGIVPVKQSSRFREFCLELLHTREFVVQKSGAIVHGNFHKSGAVAVGFASSEKSIHSAISGLERAKATRRCILTNFVPRVSSWEYCRTRNIAVFHYSMLDEYLIRKMQTPRTARRR